MKKSIITDQLSTDFEKAVFEAKKLKYDFVEIHSLWNKTIENLDNSEIELVSKILKKYKMGVSCIATTLFLMTPLYSNIENLEKFSEDFLVYIDTYENHVECFKECLLISKKLDAQFIRVFPFIKERGVSKDLDEIIDDIAEKLLIPLRIAEKEEQEIIVENCPHTYLPKGNIAYKLIKKINNKYIKLLWDPANSIISEYFQSNIPFKYLKLNILEEYKLIKEAIAYCHVKDFKRYNDQFAFVPFGEGEIDYNKLFTMFKDDGYGGFLSLETELDKEGVIKSIKNYSDLFKTI